MLCERSGGTQNGHHVCVCANVITCWNVLIKWGLNVRERTPRTTPPKSIHSDGGTARTLQSYTQADTFATPTDREDDGGGVLLMILFSELARLTCHRVCVHAMHSHSTSARAIHNSLPRGVHCIILPLCCSFHIKPGLAIRIVCIRCVCVGM